MQFDNLSHKHEYQLARAHPAFFAKYYLEDIETPPHQIQWYNHFLYPPIDWHPEDYDKVGIGASRDMGKSTMFQVLCLWRICRSHNHRHAWVGYKEDLPILRVKWIKTQIERHHRIQEDFGVYPDKSRGWGTTEFFIERDIDHTEPTCFCYGLASGGTGLHMEYMYWDDILTQENSRTNTLRRNIAETIQASVYPQVVLQLGAIFTPKHPEDYYSSFADFRLKRAKSEGWRCYFYPAYDDEAAHPEDTLLWPERYTLKRLETKRKQFVDELGSLGQLMYDQEYLLHPHAIGGEEFKDDWLLYYDPAAPPFNLDRLPHFIGVDPAVSESGSDTASYNAVVIAGYAIGDDTWYIRGMHRDRTSYGELPMFLSKLIKHWKPRVPALNVGIEAVFWMDSLTKFVAQQSNHRIIPVDYAKAGIKAKKDDRIRRLQPYFMSHRIKLPKPENAPSIQTFIDKEYRPFPLGQSKDLLDALNIAIMITPQKGGLLVYSW